MAEMLYDVVVKMGRAIRVKNLNPKHNEADVYIAIHVEDKDGKNEHCILFTEKEFEKCPVVDVSWEMEPGRLYPYFDEQWEGFFIKTYTYSVKRNEWYTVVKRITNRRLVNAEHRAKKNPEDLTKKNWLVSWLD